MLINLKEILVLAEEKKCAIGSFNTPNLESLMAVLQTAEQFNIPVIINHAQIHEEVMPLDIIGPIMVGMAKKSSVPVCVHLDHGEDLNYLQHALELGFTSVMYDGSVLPYESNVANTQQVVKMAEKFSAGVEAELGVIGGRETGDGKGKNSGQYTDPILAMKFVEETNIDALACSFGTAHGFYTVKPVLDLDRINKIRDMTKMPLVMHGGSGINPADYKKSIANGIRKINYYSYMSKAGVLGVKDYLTNNNDVQYFHDVANVAIKSMMDDLIETVKIFYNLLER